MESEERKQYRLSCPLRKTYTLGGIRNTMCSIQDKECTHNSKCRRMYKFDEGLV